MTLESIGASIKAHMLARGYTVKDLAKLLYLTQATVYRWLAGGGEAGILNLIKIADSFGITIDELLTGGEMLRCMGFDVAQLKDGWCYVFQKGKKIYAKKFDHRLTIEERKDLVKNEILTRKGSEK